MISVILVTFNSIGVLPNCLSSLERCSAARELEIILVDNASTDGTSRWVEQYESGATNLPFHAVRVRNLSQNYGYAYANNRGLDMARGDYLLLLNPDTVVGESTIEVCLRLFTRDANIGAVGCRLVLADGRLDRACKRSFPTLWNSFARLSGLSLLFPLSRFFSSYNLTFLDDTKRYSVDCISGAFMMLPRRVYEKVGGLDEAFFMYGEDLDWCYRIKHAGLDIWYEGTVTTIHMKGGNGGKRSRQSLRHFYDTMYLYYVKTRKHGQRTIVALGLRGLLQVLFYFHAGIKGLW